MRFAAGLAYDGNDFHGFQCQKELYTVQSVVEQALSKLADHPVKIVCAGRTDAGVHAKEQVIHFDSLAVRSEHAWLTGGNYYLPKTVAFQWIKKVSESFHARFSAKQRDYRYLIYNHRVRSVHIGSYAMLYSYGLNLEAMQEAAEYLIGEQDFSSFRGGDCQSRSPIRCVKAVNIKKQGRLISIDISANAFLYQMVRNIVGTLLLIGRGQKPAEWMQSILLSKDRRSAGFTAPPHGLYLMRVHY